MKVKLGVTRTGTRCEFLSWVKISTKTYIHHNYAVKLGMSTAAMKELIGLFQYQLVILCKGFIFRVSFGWIPSSDIDLKNKELDIKRAKIAN